jgi:hypothetical protein
VPDGHTARRVAGAHLSVPTPLATHLPHVGRLWVTFDVFGALVPAATAATPPAPACTSASRERTTRHRARASHKEGFKSGEPSAVALRGVAHGAMGMCSQPW